MKRLFNSRFLFILASSLVVLIGLIIGAFYLFDDDDSVFINSGYILNPLSSTSEKYFFDENIGYKENLSSMIEFKDVDNNKVSVLKDSFIHYMDESISFLKKGALLDLDSIKGEKAVSFYNITNQSVISKKQNGYLIESVSGDIELKNFIGRISDNKYIVVGDLNLKMAGNSTLVKGDYFEVVYVEEGIVNIENKDVKYQVAAADTFINVGDGVKVDLGNKKIMSSDKDVMSITSITINGDENIEIIPKAQEGGSGGGAGGSGGGGAGSGDGTGNGTGTGNGSGTGDGNGDGNGEGSGGGGGAGSGFDGSASEDSGSDGTGAGEGNGSGGTGNDGVDGEVTEDTVVSLKEVSIGSTNIDVIFDVASSNEDDLFKLQVVNLSTGRTVDVVASVLSDVLIQVNLLTPNTKYLFMVVNERDNGKYFQKIFETTGFGIKLEKTYATDSSLVYKILVDENADITNAKLSLYKFNEETMKNEIVTTSYYDSETGEKKEIEKVTYLTDINGVESGEYEIIYDGLDSNTIYTAVLDEFSVASSNFKDIYNITLTSMTLKKTPSFSDMIVTKNVGKGSFDLSLSNIVDTDNAIVNYTYMIYSKHDNKLAISPIVKNNASPITVSVGEGADKLKNDTNYYYKAVIEYYDNEKYIEYVTSDSITFVMGMDPYITVVPNDSLVSHESIGATIYLKDNSCLVSMPGRDKCNGTSSTVIEVSRVNSLTGELFPVFTKLVDFVVSGDEIKYDLYVDGLQAGNTYNIEVKAVRNDFNSEDKEYILHTDESKRTITTKSLTNFIADWTDLGSSANHVVNVQNKFIADEETGTLNGEESAASIEKVTIKLYTGNNVVDLEKQKPLATKNFYNTDEFNIKESFYDNGYVITTDGTFGLNIDMLKELGVDGKLSEYYTIVVNAYYDIAGKNDVVLTNNIITYQINPILFMDDIEDPVINIEGINNGVSRYKFKNLNNNGTIVGYKVTAAFDRAGLVLNKLIPENINIYVYGNNKNRIKFYIIDESGNLQLVDKITASLGESNYYETMIYMDYGTAYENIDDKMTRGNLFYIGYDIETISGGEKLLYPAVKNEDSPSDYGLYELVLSEKETPSVKMYISKSDKNSITYSYSIKDPDNAIYKETGSESYGFYAKVNDGKENKFDLTMSEGSYNIFDGEFTISGMKNKDLYTLYYKKNLTKTGVFDTDIVNYLDGEDSGIRLFDGFYDAKDAIYNFKYQIINNPEDDNKVTIKILADEEILGRILSYKIKFTDSKGNVLDKELWNLSLCEGDSEDATPRCLSVDYTELKNAGMKSEQDKVNLIKVNIQALYDNGLTGYSFKVGADEEYKYMIMQNNNTEAGLGNYVGFSNDGKLSLWNGEFSRGYYTYNRSGSLIYYESKLNPSNKANISVNLSSVGYSSKYGILNPKMVSVDDMACDVSEDGTCNTFSFSSITPKVGVKESAAILNGSVMNLILSGVDLNDMKNEKEGTNAIPEYYVYIETWDDESLVGDLSKVARPTLGVRLDNSIPNGLNVAKIEGLQDSKTYYFLIYAKMYIDNKYVYQQLCDAKYSDDCIKEAKYSFKTLGPNDIFHSLTVGHSASDEVYGNRFLDTKINLSAYKNKVPFNFDITYVLCDVSDFDNCGPENGNNNIFSKTISSNEVSTSITDSYDISAFDLEFGKNYYLMVYANIDLYSKNDDGELIFTKSNILLNRYDIAISLNKLREPTFTVTRNAVMVNEDEYAIDFEVIVNDPDRTLVDGNYFVKLTDTKGNVVGNMQLLGEDLVYYDVPSYDEHEFDAFVVSKKIRITGLEPDTKYIFKVYNDAYLNNYSESTLPGRENRTYEVNKAYTVYSTNNYGVAFGKEILYSATEKSIVVTFSGGSNFDNVVEVNYTVLNDETLSNYSGTFVIGENNKYFEIYQNSDNWVFIINPTDMKNVLGQIYNINLSFKVKIPGTEEFVILTSADNPKFEGQVLYVEEEK